MTKTIFTLLIVSTWFSLTLANADEKPVEFNTDFRYRYEFVDDDSKDSSRRRNRIRSRFSLIGNVGEQLKINLRFATAEKNPTSANQDLGHDFSLKDIGLDQFYFDYSISDNFSLLGGKVKNPYFKANKSELIFDGDYNPEGLALHFNNGIVFGSIGTFSMDEHESVDDISISGFQVGVSNKTSTGARYKIALARYSFDDISGRPASEITWNGKIFGNPTDASGNYLNNYTLNNFSAEINANIGAQEMPAIFFIDWVKNSEADSDDSGYQIGLKLSFVNSWNVTYFYQDLEKNAVFGALTNSDFGGGGAGHKGHGIKLNYGFSKNLSVEFTWFDNDKDMTTDYSRIFLDLKYKY